MSLFYNIFLGILILGWWILVTICLPVWILVMLIGITFRATSFKEAVEFIWVGLYRFGIMER